MLLANFNGKEHLRHRAVSLQQHGFLVNYVSPFWTCLAAYRCQQSRLTLACTLSQKNSKTFVSYIQMILCYVIKYPQQTATQFHHKKMSDFLMLVVFLKQSYMLSYTNLTFFTERKKEFHHTDGNLFSHWFSILCEKFKQS